MTHRIGRVVPQSPAVVVGAGLGTEVAPGRWRVAFSPPPAGTGTKFLMLHFTGATLGAGDRIEVPLGYDTDTFDSTDGLNFWSRPLSGNSVDIFFVDGGSGTGQASLTEFGRGEGLQLGGANSSAGGNGNGDVFMIATPFAEPTFFNSAGVCPSGASPSWENVEVLPAGVMRDTARSVGILIDAHGSDISTCSATLIGPDLILTAGHCAASLQAIESGSFTLDFQTDAAGNRPAGYNPRFHKMKRLVKIGFAVSGVGAGVSSGSALDYAVIQIETPPGGLGVPPRPIRATLPALGEELFVIHHPRGTVKKVSRKPTDPTCQVLAATGTVLTYACDSDNGSSGSSVFDTSGSIVAVNDWAPGACGNQGQAAAAFLPDFTNPTPALVDVNAMLVLDRSGSMSGLGFRGDKTKMQEAKEAAALFVDLLRTDRTHQVGLVTFSTTASLNSPLAPITPTYKDTLIGPAPARNAGTVGGITPGGLTTIGGGLTQAQSALPGASPNLPAILLLTDGLENTPPMISSVEGTLGNTRVCIVGFGSEGSVDGPRLTTLARNHGGIYTRAGEGLQLKKFFVLCFGNIFQTGISLDPFFVFPAGSATMPPFPLQVCGEEIMTVVLSWESDKESLFLNLITPAGNTITRATPGVFSSSGSTWVYFRLQLPFAGEHDGTWQVQVTRFAGEAEFPARLEEERFFVTAAVDGGPYFRPLAPRHYYTGDTINPQVVLREPSGFLVHHAEVKLDVEVPQQGTGNILTETGLRAATVTDGDAIDARASTLIALEEERGGLISVTTRNFELVDDGDLDGDGALEPDGVFGRPITDLTRFEGNYTFHAVATYGHECTGTRETTWTTYVAVGIDPGNTTVTTTPLDPRPDGGQCVRMVFTPRDKFGNFLGPGRSDTFKVEPRPGSTPSGPVVDLGNGSYQVDLCSDPDSLEPPGIVIVQPDRPPVTIGPLDFKLFVYSVKFICGEQKSDRCGCSPVQPGRYSTEINIHNPEDKDAPVLKRAIPLVLAGAVSGREPKFKQPASREISILPPHSATMDDCCHLLELLLGAPPAGPVPTTLAVFEIVSTVQLSVTAVYTAIDGSGGRPSIDVEQVEGKILRF
jgi:hypothetical protein